MEHNVEPKESYDKIHIMKMNSIDGLTHGNDQCDSIMVDLINGYLIHRNLINNRYIFLVCSTTFLQMDFHSIDFKI